MVSEGYITYLTRFIESDVPWIKKLAAASMGDLLKKIEAGELLWIPNREGRGYVMNEEEYVKYFPIGFRFRRNGIQWINDGSMQSVVVRASPLQVVEVYMDMTKWLAVYPNFVSKVKSFYQLSTTEREATTDSCDLQLMSAEFQVPCPIVPTRETIFMRYCKQVAQQIWAVVDFSLDSVLLDLPSDPSIKCLRSPSGCTIQELPNGFSKVTWVEHVAVTDEVVHPLVEPILQSGVGYGAMRWMSTLGRQCERIAYTIAETNPEILNGIMAGQGRKSMAVLKLNERVCREYFGGATASNAYGWTYVSGDGVDDVKIMKKENVTNTRIPFGVVLSASLCIQLPIPSQIVFDFIRNIATRSEWDVHCKGAEFVQEQFRFATGPKGNRVSVLQVHRNEEQQKMLILQETSTELTSSSIIYAPLYMDSMVRWLSGDANPDKIEILPSGFTIIPTKLPASAFIGGNPEATSLVGTLLTASFQILFSPFPGHKPSDHSIEMVKGLVKTAIESINNALIARIG